MTSQCKCRCTAQMIVIYVFIFALMKLVVNLFMHLCIFWMYVSISSWLVHSLNHTNHIHVLMYLHKLHVCTWSISNPNKTKVHWQTLARLRTFWVVSATVWEEHGLLTTIRGCLSYQHGACFVTQKAWQDSKLQIPRLCNLEYMSWAIPTLSSHFSDPLSARLTDCDDTICRSSRNQSQMPTAEHDWCNDAGYHNKHTKIMHSSRKVWNSWSCLATPIPISGGGVESSNMYNSYSWKQVGIKQHGL